MNIQVFYDTGRVDEFNVERFTLPLPFDGNNMLTNFEVRFDNLDTDSLWLQAHFYDTRTEYRQDTPADTTPVARRMRGWRFLLVDKTEIKHVSKIVMNDEMVAWRVGDALINGVKFQAQELACFTDDTSSSINSKVVAVHNYLANANPLLAVNEEELCRAFGFTQSAYERVLKAEECQPKKEENEAKPEKVVTDADGPNSKSEEGPWLDHLPKLDQEEDFDNDLIDEDSFYENKEDN